MEADILLICPRCRRREAEKFLVFTLERVGDFLICQGCYARYPVVDGIPVIFRELERFLEMESPELLKRSDLSQELESFLACNGVLARNQKLLQVYQQAPISPLHQWFIKKLSDQQGLVLEGGCGLGLSKKSIGLDSNSALLRASICEQKICADLADPPFLPMSFDTVVLANVLDSCRDPGLILAQSAALLKPGGTFLISCAFAFQDTITPPTLQFSPEQLLTGLQHNFSGYPLGLKLEEQLDTEWRLPLSSRTTHLHTCLCIRATRPAI